MRITSAFDGGNILCEAAGDPRDIRLAIRADAHSHFYQWFHFRVTGAADVPCTFRLTNAGGAAYTAGWEGYRAVASYDRESWFRVPTRREGEALVIAHEPEHDSVYYAYFAPYGMERHADLLASIQAFAQVRIEPLGHTLDGQDLDLLVIGEPTPERKRCWFVARQHPGETMAEWWIEGFLERLLDEDDPVARDLLDQAVCYVVPNMNPDGTRRGHLRTNAAGVNLNRAWRAPSLEESPEVYLVRRRMHETGVDCCLDVHGDETLPFNFIAGAEGIPGWTERQAALTERFKATYARLNPDFQTEHGYALDAPASSDLRKCTDYVAQTFGCLAMTLEMPFKDNANRPDEVFGWSPGRSRALGASALDVLRDILEVL